MRRVTVASAAFLVALAGQAFAADPPVDLPTTAPGFDWTGYLAGLRAGYGWGSSDITGTDGTPFSSPDLSGGYIGGQVAGLWQFNQFVIGSEADLNYSGINGSADQAPGRTKPTRPIRNASAPIRNGKPGWLSRPSYSDCGRNETSANEMAYVVDFSAGPC